MIVSSVLDAHEFELERGVILEELAMAFTTRSNIYTISSRGQSGSSGAECEIIATVDRSTVPVRILEYREE